MTQYSLYHKYKKNKSGKTRTPGKPRKKLTDDEITSIVSLRKSGISFKAISEQLGININTVAFNYYQNQHKEITKQETFNVSQYDNWVV